MVVRRAYDKIQKDGLIALIKSSIILSKKNIINFYNDTVRNSLPKQGKYRIIDPDTHPTLEGKRILLSGKYEKRMFDSVVPWRTPYDDKRWGTFDKHEQELIEAIGENVNVGDKVVVVGGGYGGTTIYAAHKSGPQGEVIAYEGSTKRAESIEESIKVNQLPNATVENKIVGSAVHVADPEFNGPKIPVTELPSCDVLEIDAEGAESYIIENLNISPEIIIVETHGCYGAPEKNVKSLLIEQGYKIINLDVLDSSRNIVILTAECE
jgi:precorrin-6B methylase 2